MAGTWGMESPHPSPPPTRTSTALPAAMMSNPSAAFKRGVCIACVTCDTMPTHWRGIHSVRLSAGVKLAYVWGELRAACAPFRPSYSSPRKAVRPEASGRTSAPLVGCKRIPARDRDGVGNAKPFQYRAHSCKELSLPPLARPLALHRRSLHESRIEPRCWRRWM